MVPAIAAWNAEAQAVALNKSYHNQIQKTWSEICGNLCNLLEPQTGTGIRDSLALGLAVTFPARRFLLWGPVIT
jgi:hypothetical protein